VKAKVNKTVPIKVENFEINEQLKASQKRQLCLTAYYIFPAALILQLPVALKPCCMHVSAYTEIQSELKGFSQSLHQNEEKGRILIRGPNPRSLQLLGGKGGGWVSRLGLPNAIVWSGGLPPPPLYPRQSYSLAFRLTEYRIHHHHFNPNPSFSILYFVHPCSLVLFLSRCNK
jgi:hypothetical protein